MDIVTGHVGSAHVTSWQDRDLNQGIFGPDTYILNVGSQMAASIITNNEIHIADGALVMQGCQGVIQKGTYDSISIDNGTAGMKRIDLICAEYTKVGGVESLGWTVIKGTPAASNPSEPSYTSGDIQNGDTPVQVPIYRAVLDGLTLTSVDAMVDTQGSVSDVSGDLATLSSTVGTLYRDYQTSSLSLPDRTYTDLASVSVPAGIYVVSAGVKFGSNMDGLMRNIRIAPDSGMEVTGTFQHTTYSSSPIITRGCMVMRLFGAGTISVQGYQDSGSTILVTEASIMAVRIK